jgi:hypothetical protein
MDATSAPATPVSRVDSPELVPAARRRGPIANGQVSIAERVATIEKRHQDARKEVEIALKEYAKCSDENTTSKQLVFQANTMDELQNLYTLNYDVDNWTSVDLKAQAERVIEFGTRIHTRVTELVNLREENAEAKEKLAAAVGKANKLKQLMQRFEDLMLED